MAKITTKITSFSDVQKSLQEIEKVLNELTQSVNSSAETEVSDKDGKTGDIKTQRNADGTYSFEVKTDEGWKVPALGNSLIKFKDKLNTIRQTTPKSIEELDESDASTGDSTANLTTFDEKNNKFILPRPDYDSGWNAISTNATFSYSHNLNLTDVPRLLFYWISGTSTGGYPVYGPFYTHGNSGVIVTLSDANTIKLETDDQAIAGEQGSTAGDPDGAELSSGYIRVFIWK
mgnify:CR=1 FL=1|tara:strand:- start:384 stop:1079 length:696 start_codon:yes stop_codon:yes gene_type:complete